MLTIEKYFPASFIRDLREQDAAHEDQASPSREIIDGCEVIYLAGLRRNGRQGMNRQRPNGDDAA